MTAIHQSDLAPRPALPPFISTLADGGKSQVEELIDRVNWLTRRENERLREGRTRRIQDVFVFPNGMVAVTDQFGAQMPVYQGSLSEELWRRICEDASSDARFHGRERTS